MSRASDEAHINSIVKEVVQTNIPNATTEQKEKIANEVKEKVASIFHQDRWFYRGVMLSLAAVAIIVVFGSILMTSTGHTIDTAIVAIGSAAVGGLVGIFTATE